MAKRCKNCGWLNDDNFMECQKCSAPLGESNVASTQRSIPQIPDRNENEGMRRTVSESSFFDTDRNEEVPRVDIPRRGREGKLCPKCGYPVVEGMRVCPDCGTSLYSKKRGEDMDEQQECWNCGKRNPLEARFCSFCGEDLDGKKQAEPRNEIKPSHARMGTVNPWMKPDDGAFCTLKPLPWDGENVDHQPISFSGKSIVLSRDNTDPNNQSITSSEQAILSFEDGEWFIVDKSSMHTTYVQASHSTKLHKGDIIVLGNRLFEFN